MKPIKVKPTDLILKEARSAVSKDGTGAISLAAVLRDARIAVKLAQTA